MNNEKIPSITSEYPGSANRKKCMNVLNFFPGSGISSEDASLNFNENIALNTGEISESCCLVVYNLSLHSLLSVKTNAISGNANAVANNLSF